MRIAVTGGAGYIGSVVSEVLIGEGHEVLMVDDLSTGHLDAVSEQARIVPLDIGNRQEVTAALLAFGTEAVIHMAASFLVGESVAEPAKYYATNVYFNAAGATERNGERHDPETHLNPLVLHTAARRRRHVTVFGDDYPTDDGTCVRDYVHVEDIARAHVLALATLEPATASVYNLGCGGRGFSVREVINAASAVTGRSIPVQIAARRPGDPAVLIASAELARRRLGWEPHHRALEAIVSSAWAWMVRHGWSEAA